ncbi:MAG: TIR domain-containing protein [Oscillospiraceae bacterium]|nr:TIR domain-containing protein [Oscillospiraceae bacterium]
MKKTVDYEASYDVFISYRRDGGESMAILLHDRLTAKGYSVFLDVESLNSGTFNTQLLSVIEKCKDVIVVLSKGCLDRCVNEDDWVRMELAHAFKFKRNVVPFMLRGFEWGDNLPEDISELPLQNGVNSNSNEYFDASIERLVKKFLNSKPRRIPIKNFAPAIVVAAALVPVFIMFLAYNINNNNGNYDPYDDDRPAIKTTVKTDDTDVPPKVSEASETVQTTQPQEVRNNDYSEYVTHQTISSNNNWVVAVKNDGTVYTYGDDLDLSGWSDIVSVSVGVDHVLGLKSDGTVLAMGGGSFGQCNVASWKDIIAIHAGWFNSFGITRNGDVLIVGDRYGYDEKIIKARDVIMITAGMHHVVALKADGTVEVFGNESRGEHLTSGWTDIVSIAAADFFTIGIKSDGSIVTTGENIWEHDRDYASPWCDDIKNWSNIKTVTLVTGRDMVGVKRDGTVIVSYGGTYGDTEMFSDFEWQDIVGVALLFRNIVGLKSDGTVVFTINSPWDEDDFAELKNWGNIKT